MSSVICLSKFQIQQSHAVPFLPFYIMSHLIVYVTIILLAFFSKTQSTHTAALSIYVVNET